jgi:diguanylate cyclase (GGDEF)-like protein
MSLGLDIRTLCLMVVFVSVTYLVELLMKQRSQFKETGVRTFFYANFLFMIGFLMHGFGGEIDFWASKVLSSVTISSAFFLIVLSLCQLMKSPKYYVVISGLILLITILVLIYFTFFSPSTNARLIVISFYIALCSLMSIAAIKTGTTKDSKSTFILLILVLAINSVFMIYRVWFTLYEVNIDDFLLSDSIHQISILFTALLVSIVGATYSWTLNSRIMQAIYRSSLTDTLTQVYNREAMNDLISHEIMRNARYNRSTSFVFLDVDHFKEVNDIYGHQTGDRVLSGIGQLLLNGLRGHDLAFRYGGEEFLIVLSDTDFDGACQVAEKLRVSIESKKFWLNQTKPITASFGVRIHQKGNTISRTVKQADTALYYAKEHGRNVVGCFDKNHNSSSIDGDVYLLGGSPGSK